MYALVKDLSVQQYPYSTKHLVLDNPETSFPEFHKMSEADLDSCLSGYGVFKVKSTPYPTYDAVTHRLVERQPTAIDGVWTQQWEVIQLSPEEVANNMEALRDSIKKQVTRVRWERETGGITLPGGVLVGTSIDDQNRITSVIANAQLAGVGTVDFKAATGWVTLTLAEVRGIAAAIAAHVQACFSAERVHHEAIDAITTPERLQEYDISAGWPE